MQSDKASDGISDPERREEPKIDSQAKANTLEYVEEEPEPQLHLKTYLIVAVSLYGTILSHLTSNLCSRPSLFSHLPN